MHPLNNTSRFKTFVYKNSILKIFIGFIILYLILSLAFSIIYYFTANSCGVFEAFKYSVLSSFSFDSNKALKGGEILFIVNFIHSLMAMLLSTIFTAAIVLKFFYLPIFFVFKKKMNHIKGTNELTISLYNGIDLFVTNCNVRIYGRKQSLDENGAKSLSNINDNKPIFEKFYPFMEMHLTTRLRLLFKEGDMLWEMLKEDKLENEKLDLIILIEANATNVDGSIYEIYKYSIDGNDINSSIDFKGANSIELDFDDYSKSIGWDKFDT